MQMTRVQGSVGVEGLMAMHQRGLTSEDAEGPRRAEGMQQRARRLKVERLRAEIARGGYRVATANIAEALMSAMGRRG